MDDTLISLGTGSLLCLMPVGLYLLYLSYLNGRVPPTLVRGPWDFAALLLGLSGFLLLAGPMLLSLVDSTWRYYVFGNWAALKGVGRAEARAWSMMALGWVLMWVGILPLLLRARRNITAVYNIVPALVETHFVQTLDELGYQWRHVDGFIEIDAPAPTNEHAEARLSRPRRAYVRITLASATAHALLRWAGASYLVRDQVEAVLPNVLARGVAQRNPVAGWLFIAAMTVMVIMLVWMAVLIMVIMTPSK